MPLSLSKQFGSQLRELRLQRNLTQAQIAEKLHMSERQIRRLEQGQSRISFDLLEHLAKLFNVPVAALFQDLSTHDAKP